VRIPTNPVVEREKKSAPRTSSRPQVGCVCWLRPPPRFLRRTRRKGAVPTTPRSAPCRPAPGEMSTATVGLDAVLMRLVELERREEFTTSELLSLRSQVERLEEQNEGLQRTVGALQSQQASLARKEEERTPPMGHGHDRLPDRSLTSKPKPSSQSLPTGAEQERETGKRRRISVETGRDMQGTRQSTGRHTSARDAQTATRNALVSSWLDVAKLLQNTGPLLGQVAGQRPQFVERSSVGKPPPPPLGRY
jgi:hypothetical protein